MAGAYKGLTIRIGADTSNFSRALRSANSVIYKTQSELNKLSRATKIDPGNQNAAALQLGRLSEQAGNYAREIDLLKKGIGELGTTTTKHFKDFEGVLDGESVAELASATDDVTSKAQKWTDAYTEAGHELDTLYNKLNEISGREGDLAFSNSNGNTSMREITEEVERLVVNHKMARDEADLYLATLAPVKRAWNEARQEMDNYANAAELGKLNDKLAIMQTNIKKTSQEFAGMVADTAIGRSVGAIAEKTGLISKAADTASDRFRRLNEASKLNPNSIGTAADRARALGEATRTASEKAKSLKEQLAAYKAQGIDTLAAKTKDASLAFEQAKENVARLKAELEVVKATEGETSDKAKELGRALKEAVGAEENAAKVNHFRELQVQLREVQADSKAMRSSLVSDLGSVGAAAVQAAIEVGNLMQRAGSRIIESSNEIDVSYRNLRKTFDGTESDYKKLYDAAMEYSKSNVTSADQMLEMEAIAAQLGIGLEGGADAIQKFAEVAANLDVATDIDAETIALQLGQIVNVMDDLDARKPESIEGFADALVRMGNTMPAQESSIMQIAQRLSAIGDVAHFTSPQLLGWASAIAATGQRSEAAATGISTTITNISKAVSGGGDELKKWADLAGESAEKFAKDWREKPSETLEVLIGKLGELGDEGFAELENLDINGVRQTQTLMALAQTAETVGGAIGRAEEAFNGGGDAALEAGRKAEGFSGSLAKMQNSAQVLAATMGEALKPYLDLAADAMNRLSDYINSLDDDTKDAIVRFGLLATGFAVAAPIVGALAGSMLSLVKNVRTFAVNGLGFLASKTSDFATIMLAANNPIEGLAVGLGSLINPANLAVIAFGGLAAVIAGVFAKKTYDAYKRVKTFDDTVGGVMGSLDGLNEQLRLGGDYVSDYGGAYKDAMEDYNDFIESIQQHNKNIKDTRDETGESIAMLERYKQIIDEAAGAGEDYAGSYGELQWAVDGLNEMLGTSYDVNDVLAGKYKDEAGEVHNLRDEVDKLIESKKRELQLAAMSDIYTETYKAYKEAEIEAGKAQQALDDYMKDRREQLAGSTTRDNSTGKIREMTQAEIDSLIIGDDAYKDLEAARSTAIATLKEEGEAVDLVTDAYDGYARAAYDASTSMGVREGFMRTNMDFVAAAEEVGKSGDELTVFAKTLAKRVEECGVSTDDFANMMPLLADKVRETGGDMQSLIEWCVEYNSQEFPDKYINVHFDEDGNLRNAEDQLVKWSDEAKNFVPVEIKGDATQLMAAEETARNAVENGEAIKVPMEVDEASAQASAEQAKANAAGDPVELDAEVDGSQVQGEIDAAAEGAEANVDITADGSQAQQEIQETTAAISDAEVKVVVSADTTAAQSVIDALAKIPSEVVTNIVVRGSKLGGIADNIQRVNDAASKMTSTKAKYTASGNAATDATVSTKIDRVAKAGASMKSNTVSYNAYGNIVNSDTAVNRVWSMVNAVSRLQSKSITLTTTQKTVKKTVSAPAGAGESATGAYIPYNKIPKHAAGIFTRPTLTNIGWVGEDGAELYSGNSLVPLTNRKYSMPYINDISDAVARKIGGTGTQYSVYIDGARINDDPAIQAAFLGLFDVLQRKGAMNRG